MRIVYMGTPEFAVTVLQALIDHQYEIAGVVTQPDRLTGRKQLLTPPPVKQLALKYHIPIFQPEKIRTDYEPVLDWKPDLIITCAYGQIIPQVLLDAPKLGAVNVHASLLPKYRGGAPIQKAIMDGSKKTGITIMYMSAKMDAGDKIAQSETVIHADDTLESLSRRLALRGAKLLLKTMPAIISQTAKRTRQSHTRATFAYNITKEQEKIDWTTGGESIYNLIRALNPAPGAYALYNNERVKMVKAQLVKCPQKAAPGEIIRIAPDGIFIASGDETCMQVTEMQLAGKTIQKVKDILNGKHPFEIGKIFK